MEIQKHRSWATLSAMSIDFPGTHFFPFFWNNLHSVLFLTILRTRKVICEMYTNNMKLISLSLRMMYTQSCNKTEVFVKQHLRVADRLIRTIKGEVPPWLGLSWEQRETYSQFVIWVNRSRPAPLTSQMRVCLSHEIVYCSMGASRIFFTTSPTCSASSKLTSPDQTCIWVSPRFSIDCDVYGKGLAQTQATH